MSTRYLCESGRVPSVEMKYLRECRTYGMNDLQHIDEQRYGPVLVTLNPPFSPERNKIQGHHKYDHPILDAAAVDAQRRMHTIQGAGAVSYAGAWLNFGFHEDAWTSGLLAATRYAPSLADGISLPWAVEIVEGSSWAENPGKNADSTGTDGILVRMLVVAFDLAERSGLRSLVGSSFGSILGVALFVMNVLLPWKIELE